MTVNGRQVATKQVRPEEILGAPSRFEVDPAWLRDGANEVVIRRLDGDGPLYFAVDATFFSLEEPITAAGNEIFVRRQYFKLFATLQHLLHIQFHAPRPLRSRRESERRTYPLPPVTHSHKRLRWVVYLLFGDWHSFLWCRHPKHNVSKRNAPHLLGQVKKGHVLRRRCRPFPDDQIPRRERLKKQEAHKRRQGNEENPIARGM